MTLLQTNLALFILDASARARRARGKIDVIAPGGVHGTFCNFARGAASEDGRLQAESGRTVTICTSMFMILLYTETFALIGDHNISFCEQEHICIKHLVYTCLKSLVTSTK